MKLLNIFICLILFSLSCKVDNDLENYPFKNIEVRYYETVKLSQLIDPHFQYIFLETDTNNFIGQFSKIIRNDSSIYILDSEVSKKIFCYNLSGSYLFSFGDLGAGPGEYGQPTDIVIKDNELLVSDGSNFSILNYNLDGKFIREKKTPIWIKEFLIIENQFIVYSPTNYLPRNGSNIITGTDVLKIMSDDFNHVEASFFPYEENHDDTGLPGQLASYNQQFSFVKSIYGEIFSFNTNNQLLAKYKVDFGKYSWPISMEKIKADQELAEETFRSKNVMSLIHRLCENSRYLVFQAYMSSEMMIDDASNDKWLIIYNKREDECYAIHNVINDIDGGVFTYPISSDNESFISVIDLTLLKNKISSSTINLDDNERMLRLKSKIDGFQFYDNSLLMKFDLKSNIIL